MHLRALVGEGEIIERPSLYEIRCQNELLTKNPAV